MEKIGRPRGARRSARQVGLAAIGEREVAGCDARAGEFPEGTECQGDAGERLRRARGVGSHLRSGVGQAARERASGPCGH